MKYNRIFMLVAAATLAFACSKSDSYEFGPEEDPEVVKDEVYFSTTYSSLEIDPAVETIDVELTRVQTAEALSVPLIVSNTYGVFSVPEKAEFAAGEAKTVIQVGVTRLALEQKYDLHISIPQDYFYLYKPSTAGDQSSCHISVIRQKWDDAGTCTFTDGTFFDPRVSVKNVVIQNHAGTSDYRIVAPYAAINPAFEEHNIVFKLNEKGEVTFEEGTHDIFLPGDYMYWNVTNYSKYCYVVQKTVSSVETFEVNFLILEGGSLYLGGFFSFAWDGYPGKPGA